jgi:hypothetical protein
VATLVIWRKLESLTTPETLLRFYRRGGTGDERGLLLGRLTIRELPVQCADCAGGWHDYLDRIFADGRCRGFRAVGPRHRQRTRLWPEQWFPALTIIARILRTVLTSRWSAMMANPPTKSDTTADSRRRGMAPRMGEQAGRSDGGHIASVDLRS